MRSLPLDPNDVIRGWIYIVGQKEVKPTKLRGVAFIPANPAAVSDVECGKLSSYKYVYSYLDVYVDEAQGLVVGVESCKKGGSLPVKQNPPRCDVHST